MKRPNRPLIYGVISLFVILLVIVGFFVSARNIKAVQEYPPEYTYRVYWSIGLRTEYYIIKPPLKFNYGEGWALISDSPIIRLNDYYAFDEKTKLWVSHNDTC